MVERLLQNLSGRTQRWRARMARLHPGWCVCAVVVVAVGARYGWVAAARPVRVDEVAAAYGAASLLYGCPQLDPAGMHVAYVRQSRVGRAVCVQNLRTGERREIQEAEKPTHQLRVEVWPWSPDGRQFIYGLGDRLFPWAMEGAAVQAGLKVGQPVTDLAWVGKDHFVCVINRKRICHVRVNQGNLELVAEYQPAHPSWNLTSLNVVGTNAVGWLNSNVLWRLEVNREWDLTNVPPGKPWAGTNPAQVWLDPRRKNIGEFAGSPDRDEILFTCAGASGERELWRWDTTRSVGGMKQVAKSTAISQVRWLGAEALAYVGKKAVENRLVICRDGPGEPEVLPLVTVNAYGVSPGGHRLAISGASSEDVSEAIWIYDEPGRELKRAVAATDQPSPLTRRPAIAKGVFPLPEGGRRDVYMVRPVGYDRRAGRKYPVVLGNTTFAAGDPLYQGRPNGPLWAQALANSGCFVVVVNRNTWFGNIKEWEQTLIALYPLLAENPEMDMNQVFLFGASAETQYLSKLANERPELWKGLILLNPGGLPDLAGFPLTRPVPKMLISYGELEGQQERLKRYREEAQKRGICVEVVMHREAGHHLQAQEAVRERTRALLRFVSDQPVR